jgi:hypothetical protein
VLLSTCPFFLNFYFFPIGLPQQFPGLVLVLPHAAHLYVVQLAPPPPQHEHPLIATPPFVEILTSDTS